MTTKAIYEAVEYNGFENVLFMFNTSDFRLHDDRFSKNYTLIAKGKYSRKDCLFEANDGRLFTVYDDFSVTTIQRTK